MRTCACCRGGLLTYSLPPVPSVCLGTFYIVSSACACPTAGCALDSRASCLASSTLVCVPPGTASRSLHEWRSPGGGSVQYPDGANPRPHWPKSRSRMNIPRPALRSKELRVHTNSLHAKQKPLWVCAPCRRYCWPTRRRCTEAARSRRGDKRCAGKRRCRHEEQQSRAGIARIWRHNDAETAGSRTLVVPAVRAISPSSLSHCHMPCFCLRSLQFLLRK